MEAIVPIAPIESATLAGAWLVDQKRWPLVPTAGILALAYLAILLLQYQIGCFITAPQRRTMQQASKTLAAVFRKSPRLFTMLARLLPGLRIFVVIAAVADGRTRRFVLSYSILGSTLAAPLLGLLLFQNRDQLPPLNQPLLLSTTLTFVLATLSLIWITRRSARQHPEPE